MEFTKHILVFVDWYEPGYKAGGPIRSIANMVARLTDYRFSIVTSIYDHQSDEPYSDILPNQWIKQSGRVRVMYLTREEEHPSRYQSIMETDRYDHIYLNSMFSRSYTLTPLRVARKLGFSSKVILAPRGMLKSGALAKNRSKKAIFLYLTKKLGWFNGIRWHATNKVEKDEIIQKFGQHVNVHVAPNLCRSASEIPHYLEKQPGMLKLVTIARVSAEKNILGAIRYLSMVESGQIEWHIFGTKEDEAYLTKCEQMAEELLPGKVVFHGDLPSQQIPEKLRESHFLYLPTFGENYGHAIVESFLEGVPVIISNRTPWHKLEDQHAGWDLPLDKRVFKEVLTHCLSLDNEGYKELCSGAYALGKSIAENNHTLQSNRTLFK